MCVARARLRTSADHGIVSGGPITVHGTMQLAFTEEQRQFRDVIRRFLSDTMPTTEVRRLMATEAGFEAETWMRLAGELGVCGIHVPESYGGAGLGLTDLGIVVEEMGRTLFCGPYYSSTVLAATAILGAGTEQQKQTLLPAIAAGELRAALAFTEADGSWEPEATRLIADPHARLSGSKRFVVDGHTADLLVVLARASANGDLALYLVDADADGLARTPLTVIDETRKLAQLSFDDTPAEPLGAAARARETMEHVLHLALIALANEMIGGAGRMLESALDHTRQRMQFGRRISSFQAIKHRMADLLLEVELARSAAYYAAAAFDAGHANAAALASLAKSTCADAYMHAAAECIQLHGGIGFTWDHDTHLWYKRAKSSEVFLGDPASHRERMMACWRE
jgi:alkylation response protein AidB-like acyl-CoA dehydrogenase